MATIVSTNFVLPQTVVSNGDTTGALWLNPGNLLLSDNLVAFSQSTATQASDVTVGNYNLNLPATAVVTGIEMEIIGYRGPQTAPVITITPTLVDNTSGTDAFYPLTPAYAGLTETSATHILGGPNFLFNSAFTPDQINNAKLQLVANGAVYIDTAKLKVYYYVPDATGTPSGTTAGCSDCNSQIQTQVHRLALNVTATDTKMYLEDFVYADGTPVQVSDLGSCGGYVDFVLDNGKEKGNGQRFEENVRSGYWEVLPSGLVEVDFGVVIDYDTPVGTFTNQELVTGSISGATGIMSSVGDTSVIISKVTGAFQAAETITGSLSLATLNTTAVDTLGNRGLKFKTPYNTDPTLRSAHNASAEVIVSNNAPYEDRWVKKCQKDTFFSPPINVLDDDASIVDPVHTFNFQGNGVVVTQNPTDPFQADITIAGSSTVPPTVVSTVTNTSGNVQIINLTVPGLSVQGVNRGALVQISTEEAATVSSVVGNGSEVFVQQIVQTDVPNNLRTEQWFLVAPTVGTMSIEVTLSQAAFLTIGAEAIVDVDQASPIGASVANLGTSNTPTATNVTTTDNSITFDSLVTALTPILHTPGTNQVLNWTEIANTTTRQGSSSYQFGGSAPDNVVMDYTITQNTDWCITALEINGIASALSTLTVEDESIAVDTAVTNIDFTGTGVTATQTSPGNVQVAIPAGGGSPLTIQEEGVTVDAATTLINFIGAGATATTAGAGLIDVTIPGGAGGGSSITATANETMLAGLPVGFGIDGKIARAKLSVSNESTGAPTIGGGSSTLIKMVSIDTGKYACLFYDGVAIPDELVVYIATKDAATNTLTYSVPYVVPGTSVPEGNTRHNICKIDTDKFVITFTLDGINDAELIVGTVAGTVVSYGTKQTVAGSGNLTSSTCCQLDTDKFGFMYSTQTAGARYQGFATVSGTVVTVVDDDTGAYGGLNTTDGPIRSIKIATDKFAVGSDLGYTIVCTTVGATFAIGASVNFFAGGGAFNDMGMQSLADNTFWFLSGGDVTYATVSGTVPTLEDTLVLGSTANTITNDGTDIVYVTSAAIYGLQFVGSAIVSTPTLVTDFNAINDSAGGFTSDFDGTSYVAMNFKSSETPYFHIPGMTPNFVGALSADVTIGNPVSVTIKGQETAPVAQTIVSGVTYEVSGGTYVPTLAAPSSLDYTVIGVDATTLEI